MDTSELLRRAWEAVEKSGVPEPLREAAFQAAVEDLRAQEGGSTRSSATKDVSAKDRNKTARKINEDTPPPTATSESTFFENLEHESGVAEKELRDVLRLDGTTVTVTPATKDLGSNVAEQARTVIALVGGARSRGLGEDPVDLGAVRAEVQRKRCYQDNNFSNKHLAELKGFNRGPNRNELVLGSKWVDAFTAAVRQALGHTDAD